MRSNLGEATSIRLSLEESKEELNMLICLRKENACLFEGRCAYVYNKTSKSLRWCSKIVVPLRCKKGAEAEVTSIMLERC